ncbi:class I adenylate-forming enzyme family protein [Mycolicibacterium stellerae]|uniref:class I adenylate-forming enzyme family protein n=1 Tax=Mycolicibacterium stellerae TaxID=2358193 RepID=UPI000F0B01F7|nr:AMP-binding protein [Mycolicibacterium stellerae]
MSISLLLEMASSEHPDRLAVTSGETRLTVSELSDLADRAAGVIAGSGARHVAYVGTGGHLQPLLIFAAARACVPYTPVNYRLAAEGVQELLDRLNDPLVIVDPGYREVVGDRLRPAQDCNEFLLTARAGEPHAEFADPDSVAIVLFTSGTTSKPKAVELSHANLTSYITQTVEFSSAEPTDAALVCVPPYHIAGVNAPLSNLYAGRRVVYLPQFDAGQWLRLAVEEHITTATVVPTMLDRIVAELHAHPTTLPALRNLAYGGSKVALPLVRKALQLMPDVGFVNAYGLTETSSTIAVLTPDDHREALGSTEPAVAKRLGSVGRPVPGVEIQVRAKDGTPVAANLTGELFVRGDQVSGRYAGLGSVLDESGWFPTRDLATVDDDGYLYIVGRSDDTIIRGGENIAPAEIEDVLIEHPDVRQVAVVGVEDPQWGQIIVAVVVPEPASAPDADELREFVRGSLRGSRTPDRIVFRDELPVTPTGKVVRRDIVTSLLDERTKAASHG